jgi:hypothetical protein
LPDSLEISSHCLLRLTTSLMLEAQGVPHCQPLAVDELNSATGRRLGAREWLAILEPYYRQRFMPGEHSTPLCSPAIRPSRDR